jgi:hypothetical protein
MKLTSISAPFALALALAGSAASVFADSATQNSVPDQNQSQDGYQQPGVVAQQDPTLKNDAQAKKIVGPQSVMLQTSLMSAKAQLEGLKSQLALASDMTKPDATFLNQVKVYDHNIDNTIKDAANHESKMKTNLIKSYPQIAGADSAKNLDYSVNDLQSFYKSWSNKAKDRSYWQDKDQAKMDLDSLDKRLDKAIDQSKGFNSDQFDLSIG